MYNETCLPSVSNFVVTVVACNHLVSLSLFSKRKGVKNSMATAMLFRGKEGTVQTIPPVSAKGQNQYGALFCVRHGKSDSDSRQTVAHWESDNQEKA